MLDVNIFDSMRIGIASPDKIREWSLGEVIKKPETINAADFFCAHGFLSCSFANWTHPRP